MVFKRTTFFAIFAVGCCDGWRWGRGVIFANSLLFLSTTNSPHYPYSSIDSILILLAKVFTFTTLRKFIHSSLKNIKKDYFSMEFLKHEINSFQNEPDEAGIRRTAIKYMGSTIFQEDLEEITRQRLIFTAILVDHSNVLFGTSNERGPLWEEIRQFMIEQGASTLVDKDWKYVASCYWQNIRKDSIRRMAKMRVGTISSNKPLRPGVQELDRLVGEVINKRGAGSASLEKLICNYARNYTDEEEPAGSNEGGDNLDNRLDEESNSTAPDEHNNVPSNQSNVVIVDYHQSRNNSTKNTQNHPATSTAHAINMNAANLPKIFLAKSTKSTTDPTTNDGAINDNLSIQLGNSIAKTHSQLVTGGYVEMAMEFERNLKQIVNGYKAWMFDQIFGQDNVNIEEEEEVGGHSHQIKKAKY